MRAVLLALLLAWQAEAPPVDLSRVTAELSASPASVEIGEPMVWTLDVVHPRAVEPRLSDDDLGLDEGFVVLEASGTLTTDASDRGEGLVLTRKSWTVVSLRPTDELPSLEIPFTDEEEGPSVLTSEGTLDVRTLIDEEDAARPAKGFREPELTPEGAARVPWWVVAVVTPIGLAALAFAIHKLRRARGPLVPPARPPLERLAELEASVSTDLQALKALHYSLTALLREAIDDASGQMRAPLTDAEWLAAVQGDGKLTPAARDALRNVIERAEEVKYARHQPTKFAVDETLLAARTALEATAPAGGRS